MNSAIRTGVTTDFPSFTSQDLQAWNTLGLRCHAERFAVVSRVEHVPGLQRVQQSFGGFVLLGGGSNVVLPERLTQAVVAVRIPGWQAFRTEGEHVLIDVMAGVNWHDLVTHCVRAGVGGLENLALIPGTVGAAPVQNIGAYGLELEARLHRVLAYDLQDGKWRTFDAEDAQFAYRDSIFKQQPGRWVIVQVCLRLPKQWTPMLDYPDLKRTVLAASQTVSPQGVYDAVCAIRRAKLPDPAVLGNAGSFFKNPVVSLAQYEALRQEHEGLVGYPTPQGVKLAAGWLIEQAGWKGRRLGPVGMHERQALVLVNHGGASVEDVRTLAERVSQDVWTRYQVRLEPEPTFIRAQPLAQTTNAAQ